jgi:tRNA G18 (ribose-2'-O)-methylase SpoU
MNVRDELKNLEVEAIKNYCAANCVNAAVAMTHIHGDFNLSNVLRNANFFGFKEAFYIEGSKSWDKRGAVGVNHYTPMSHCKTLDDFWRAIEGKYVPIALENNVNYPMQNLFDFEWPDNPVIIVGEEQAGLSDSVLTKCQAVVTIPSFGGSVRSLNVGTAAGIAMGLYRSRRVAFVPP